MIRPVPFFALAVCLSLVAVGTPHAADAQGRIEGIAPPAAMAGDRVTVTGSGFGAHNVQITVGGVRAIVVAAAGHRVTFVVPAGVAPGPTTVVAKNPGGRSGSIAFEILAQLPQIVSQESARASSATISNLGGVVTATASSGTLYSLSIPPGALPGDTLITLTPIAATAGLPFSGPSVAVRMQPSGLQLDRPAILEITPAAVNQGGSADAQRSSRRFAPRDHLRWRRLLQWLRETRGQHHPSSWPEDPDRRTLGFIFDDAGTNFEVLRVVSDGATLIVEVAHFSAAGTAAASSADFAATMLPLLRALPGNLPPTQVATLVSTMVAWLVPAPGALPHFELCATTTLCHEVLRISTDSLLAHRDQACAQAQAFAQAGEPFLARAALARVTQISSRLLELDDLADEAGVPGFEQHLDLTCIADSLNQIVDVAADEALVNPRVGVLVLLTDLIGDAALLELEDQITYATAALARVINTLIGDAANACLTDPAVGESLLALLRQVFPDQFLDGLDPGLATRLANADAACRIRIAPASATVGIGKTLQFTGAAVGLNPSSVAWSVTGGGSIDPVSGLFTAANVAGTFAVVATSTADPSKTKRATFAVIDLAVAVNPANVAVQANGSQQFSATVTGLTNLDVTWTATGGTIDPLSGLFRAAAAPGTVIVRATSIEDPSVFGEAVVTVQVTGALFTGHLTMTLRAGTPPSTSLSTEDGDVTIVASMLPDGTFAVLSATGTLSYFFGGVCGAFEDMNATITGGTLGINSIGIARFTPSGLGTFRRSGSCGPPFQVFNLQGPLQLPHLFWNGTPVYQGTELVSIDFTQGPFTSGLSTWSFTGQLVRQ